VRLERHEALEARIAQRGQRLAHLPVTLAGGHHLARRREGILDLEVDKVRPEQGVGLGEGPGAALDEVRRVERRTQRGGAHGGYQVGAPRGNVAVDLLLVLVGQDEAAVRCDPGQGAHPVDDLGPVPPGLLPGRDEEGEHPHDPGAEFGGDVGDAAHPVQLGWQRRGDGDLPDGRADRRYPGPGALQRRAEGGDLRAGEVGNVDRPGAAQLQVGNALGAERRELLGRVGRDLVREPAQGDRHCRAPIGTGRPERADS